jgi:hypothetical protein
MITGFCCRYGVELSVMDGIEGNEVSLLPAPTSDGGVAIEIRPARMVWAPFFVGIPAEDAADLSPRLCIAMPEGPLEDIGVIPTRDYPGWWVRLSKVPVSSEGNKICLVCKKTPGPLVLGQIGGPRYRVVLSRDWRPRAGANPLEPPDVTG